MTLWLYDTSRSELVYNDPQSGPLRFPILAVAHYTAYVAPVEVRTLEVDLRRALPRADRSQLIVPGARFQ